MAELRNCLTHNRLEPCVRIGLGFSRFIHPELDWMCAEALKRIEDAKHPTHTMIVDGREYEIQYR